MSQSLLKLLIVPSLLVSLCLSSGCQSNSKPQSFSVTSEGDTLWGPGVYNDYLVGKQEGIIQGIVDLGASFQTFDSANIEQTYQLLSETVDEGIARVQNLHPYEGDTILKPATLRLFGFYKEVTSNEYRQITTVIQQGPDNITQSDFNRIDSLTRAIADREIAVDSAFEAAQKQFANRYDMMILDNDFAPSIDTTSKR